VKKTLGVLGAVGLAGVGLRQYHINRSVDRDDAKFVYRSKLDYSSYLNKIGMDVQRIGIGQDTFSVGLSIDGGGIKGIVPLVMLYEIQQRIYEEVSKNDTDKAGVPHLHQYFDVISGTSVGGIIGLALATDEVEADAHSGSNLIIDGGQKSDKEYISDPKALIRLFINHRNDFFKKQLSGWPDFIVMFMLNCLDLKKVSLYDNISKKNILKHYFKELCFSDLKTTVLVTSTDIKTAKPFIFGTQHTKEDALYQAAHATSTAPLYFKPYILRDKDYEEGEEYKCQYLIDGGLVANNPVLLAYRYLIDNQSNESKLLVSLGCGETKETETEFMNSVKLFKKYLLNNIFSIAVFKGHIIDRDLGYLEGNPKTVDIIRIQPYFSNINKWLKAMKKDETAVYDSLTNIFSEQQVAKMISEEPSIALDDIREDNIKLLLSYAIAYIYMNEYYQAGCKNYVSYLGAISEALARKNTPPGQDGLPGQGGLVKSEINQPVSQNLKNSPLNKVAVATLDKKIKSRHLYSTFFPSANSSRQAGSVSVGLNEAEITRPCCSP